MKLHPRTWIVQRAGIDVRTGLDRTVQLLDLSFEDALYHVAMVKAQLLKEMGAKASDVTLPENVPDVQNVLGSACYMPMMEHGLTNIELYQIITSWELSESKYMLRFERHGNFEEASGLE